MMSWGYRSAWSDPFRELRRFQDEVNRMMGGLTAGLRGQEFPLANLWANEDGLVVLVEVPGLAPDQVEITVHNNTLTLSGTTPDTPPVEGAVALRRERPHGSFFRTIGLPVSVDPERVEARADGGVLMIHLPRPEAHRPRRVRITAGG